MITKIPPFLRAARTKWGLDISYWPLTGSTLYRVISDPVTHKVLRRSPTHIRLTPEEVAEAGYVRILPFRPRFRSTKPRQASRARAGHAVKRRRKPHPIRA